MDATFEFQHAGARVALPSATIAKLWIDQAMERSPVRTRAIPTIGHVVDGATFMGVVRGEDGQPDQLVYDLGEAPDAMNWEAAKKWAAERGGSLPTRREQAVMFANREAGQFKESYYWSCEQSAGGESYAWVQPFGNGDQNGDRKSNYCRVRAVRRQAIQ